MAQSNVLEKSQRRITATVFKAGHQLQRGEVAIVRQNGHPIFAVAEVEGASTAIMPLLEIEIVPDRQLYATMAAAVRTPDESWQDNEAYRTQGR